jgi:hypothetical protein
MYKEDGRNILVHLRRDGRDLQTAVDVETYARMLNEGYELVEELAEFTRLPQDPDTGLYDPALRSEDD